MARRFVWLCMALNAMHGSAWVCVACIGCMGQLVPTASSRPGRLRQLCLPIFQSTVRPKSPIPLDGQTTGWMEGNADSLMADVCKDGQTNCSNCRCSSPGDTCICTPTHTRAHLHTDLHTHGHLFAQLARARVHPHDCIVQWLARDAMPHKCGLALVGDADALDVHVSEVFLRLLRLYRGEARAAC
eukprot:364973-Chlamydomonas_euryale.AAC.9